MEIQQNSSCSNGGYLLEVTLREVRPPIWRRLRAARRHGWTDSHLHASIASAKC
jgi:hypothetical protein